MVTGYGCSTHFTERSAHEIFCFCASRRFLSSTLTLATLILVETLARLALTLTAIRRPTFDLSSASCSGHDAPRSTLSLSPHLCISPSLSPSPIFFSLSLGLLFHVLHSCAHPCTFRSLKRPRTKFELDCGRRANSLRYLMYGGQLIATVGCRSSLFHSLSGWAKVTRA